MRPVVSGDMERFIAYLPGSSTAVTFQSSTYSNKKDNPTGIYLEDENKFPKHAPWGVDNKWPNKVLEKIEKYGVGLNGLKFNKNLHYGRGIFFYKEVFEGGKTSVEMLDPNQPELSAITDWFDRNKLKRYIKEVINDFEYWDCAFPEMILSRDFTQINRVIRKEATFCRWQVMNPRTRMIEHCFMSSKWDEGAQPGDEGVEKVPVVNPYADVDEVKEWAKSKNIKKFIYPNYQPTPGRRYYPFKGWHSVVINGWLDIALSVPQFKKHLFENQMSMKFHIRIPENYFRAKYKEWEDYSDEKRETMRNETLRKMDDFLSGQKNAGKSLVTYFEMDSDGKPLEEIKIDVIDDKLQDGKYIPDTQNADAQILGSMDVDPTLMGFGFPGASMGAGSGSDKTAAFNLRTSLKTSDREVVLEPLEFIARYNGWPKEVKIGFKDHQMTTLDKNPTGVQTVHAG